MSWEAKCEATEDEYDAAEDAVLSAKFPVGARVRVIASDEETAAAYVGKTGAVRVVHPRSSDGPPMVSVTFDEPHGPIAHDGFYEEELAVIT